MLRRLCPVASLSPLVGLIAALFAHPTLAEPGGEEQTLATVNVADRAEGDLPTEKTGRYTVKKSESATRLGLSLKETPQEVSVLTRSQLDDFHLNDLGEALGATSGIVVERPETDRVYYTARGFDVTNFQYDGIGIANVYDIAGAETDTAIFDRIDTVYGANGLLSSTGYPSATVNFIRKRPTLDFAASATATVGSWNKGRLEGDVSGALIDSGRLRGRLVGVQEDKDSYLDRYSRSKTVFYGVLEADLDDRTTLALGHHEQENKPRGVMWGALPMYNTDGSQTHYDVSTSTATDWAFWNLKTKSSFLELSRQFNEDWSGKAVVTHNEYTGNSRLFYVYGTPDRNTGLGLKAYPSEYDLERTQTQADVYATGRFELGGRKHEGGQMAQHLVPHRMTVAVIDLLEVIHVQGQGGKGNAVGFPDFQLAMDAPPVHEPGEGIGGGFLVEKAQLELDRAQAYLEPLFDLPGFPVPGPDPVQLFRGFRMVQPGSHLRQLIQGPGEMAG